MWYKYELCVVIFDGDKIYVYILYKIVGHFCSYAKTQGSYQ